ncbi:MAG: anti-sigma factor [Xanthobacteraceae bacterium]
MYDDDRDALAAEYVLGTLSTDERDQAEALLVIDPGFAEIVRVWERRLGELNVMVEAVEPPPDVWDRIKTEVDGAEQRIAAEAGTAAAAAAVVEEGSLPTIAEAAPHTAPETILETATEATPETFYQAAAEVPPEVAPAEPTETVPDLLAGPTIDASESLPEDLDETASVAALASSLLPPESQPETETPSPAQPAPSAPKSERSAEFVYLARQTRRWRGFTVAMSAIAALLAVYIAVGQFAPGLLPVGRLSQSAAMAPPPGSRLVAVLQQEPTAPAFLLTVDPQHRTMTVRRVTASADSGRSYELWLIASDNPKPRSLGLIGAHEFTTRPLPADFDVAALRQASYAVSLEPAGGSPSGVPTGPVLFTGKMVESVPSAPPPKT